MSARQEAQEVCYDRRARIADGEKLDGSPEAMADLASDVWEPLLRDLLRDIEGGGVPFSLDRSVGYQRAKQALCD